MQSECPYCHSIRQLHLLRCCFNAVCKDCYNDFKSKGGHDCLDMVGLVDDNYQIELCDRCTNKAGTHCCYGCNNKKFCIACFGELHKKQKYLNHKWCPASSFNCGTKNELQCQLHSRTRNLILENCSLGCLKCAQECKLRKIFVIEDKQTSRNPLHQIHQILEIKMGELENNKSLIVNKWESIQSQVISEFDMIASQLFNRKKEAMESIQNMRNQQLKILQEIIKIYSISNQSLKFIENASLINSSVQKIQKSKAALVSEIIKKMEKKKQILDAYEHKKQKTLLDTILGYIKTLGTVEKVKKQEEKQNTINRSGHKNRQFSNICDSSNQKRSQSRENLKQSSVVKDRKHQRVRSSSKFDPQDRKSIYGDSNSKISAIRQKLMKNSLNIDMKQSLVLTQNTSNYVTTNSNASNIYMKQSIEVKSSIANPAQKYKNEFLHLRESVKKNSTYRQSLIKRA